MEPAGDALSSTRQGISYTLLLIQFDMSTEAYCDLLTPLAAAIGIVYAQAVTYMFVGSLA